MFLSVTVVIVLNQKSRAKDPILSAELIFIIQSGSKAYECLRFSKWMEMVQFIDSLWLNRFFSLMKVERKCYGFGK
ncbi:MAG: hypothetical protein C4291_09285 [Candidatus Dadabacteria bacterium]